MILFVTPLNQCQWQHLRHLVDVVERKARKVGRGYVFHIAAVVLAQHNVGYAGAFGGENLLTDAAHGCYGATQRNLAGLSVFRTHLAARKGTVRVEGIVKE